MTPAKNTTRQRCSTESHSVAGHSYTRFALALIITISTASCEAFKVDVGTQDSIKLDPIKIELDPIDVKMRVDVYQYTGKSEEEKKEVANVKTAVENQRNRMAEIQTLKDNRLIGENHLGLISIRNLPAGDWGVHIEKTVDEENADRAFLMTDKSNTSGESLAAVRRKQWKTRIQDSFEGEWIEVPGEVEGTYSWARKKED